MAHQHEHLRYAPGPPSSANHEHRSHALVAHRALPWPRYDMTATGHYANRAPAAENEMTAGQKHRHCFGVTSQQSHNQASSPSISGPGFKTSLAGTCCSCSTGCRMANSRAARDTAWLAAPTSAFILWAWIPDPGEQHEQCKRTRYGNQLPCSGTNAKGRQHSHASVQGHVLAVTVSMPLVVSRLNIPFAYDLAHQRFR